MPVESAKTRTKIYLIVLSVVMSIVMAACLKSSMDAPAAKSNLTPDQQLAALERSAPKSPEMAKFLQHERDKREGEQQAGEDFPK